MQINNQQCDKSKLGSIIKRDLPGEKQVRLMCAQHPNGKPEWQRVDRPICSSSMEGKSIYVNYGNGSTRKKLTCLTGSSGYAWREQGLVLNSDPFDHIEKETLYDVELHDTSTMSRIIDGTKRAAQLGGHYALDMATETFVRPYVGDFAADTIKRNNSMMANGLVYDTNNKIIDATVGNNEVGRMMKMQTMALVPTLSLSNTNTNTTTSANTSETTTSNTTNEKTSETANTTSSS